MLFISTLSEFCYGEFEQIEPLDFGKVVISKNTLVSSIELNRDGGFRHNGAIYEIAPPKVAIFRVTNLPADQIVTLTGSPVGTNSNFILRSIDLPAQLSSDSRGNLTFRVGGVLETVANQNYRDDNYEIYYRISINY